MLNKFRKTKQEVKPEGALEEEVTFEPMVETPAVEIPAVDETTLSPEEQRLLEAKRSLEALQAETEQSDADARAAQDILDAQKRLEDAQAKADRIKSEKDFRFKSAQQKLQEAQADIELAKQQKAVWTEVSSLLKNFKATDVGRDMPDDTALMFAVFTGTIRQDMNWLQINDSHYFTVAIRDWMRDVAGMMGKIATYYAYRKRIGLD